MIRSKKHMYMVGEEVIYIGGQDYGADYEGKRATIKDINGTYVRLLFKGQTDYGLYWHCHLKNIKPAVLDWDQ